MAWKQIDIEGFNKKEKPMMTIAEYSYKQDFNYVTTYAIRFSKGTIALLKEAFGKDDLRGVTVDYVVSDDGKLGVMEGTQFRLIPHSSGSCIMIYSKILVKFLDKNYKGVYRFDVKAGEQGLIELIPTEEEANG